MYRCEKKIIILVHFVIFNLFFFFSKLFLIKGKITTMHRTQDSVVRKVVDIYILIITIHIGNKA